MFRRFDIALPCRNGFEHEIEISGDCKNGAGAEIIVPKIVALHVGKGVSAGVEMNCPTIAHDLTERQVDLVTGTVVADSFLWIAGGKHE